MSDYGSVEDIERKIREGIFSTIAKDSARNELWKHFVGITSLVDGEVVKLIVPYVVVLIYNSKTGGTSHLQHYIEHCLSNCGSSSSFLGIASFFKPIGIPSSVKSGIIKKCVEFVRT